jgi:hypothetical protein
VRDNIRLQVMELKLDVIFLITTEFAFSSRTFPKGIPASQSVCALREMRQDKTSSGSIHFDDPALFDDVSLQSPGKMSVYVVMTSWRCIAEASIHAPQFSSSRYSLKQSQFMPCTDPGSSPGEGISYIATTFAGQRLCVSWYFVHQARTV